MLDLQKTLDYISDKTANIFMTQVECLRKKFEAEEAVLFISSQTEFVGDLYESAHILERNRGANVKFANCYYLNGIYNPSTGIIQEIPNVNENKIQVLKQEYLNDNRTKFFAVIDDNITIDALQAFQNERPFVLIRPSQYEGRVEADNFSCYSSYARGFDGVIDGMNRYLERISSLSANEIFAFQKQELFMITGSYASWLFEQKEFDLLFRYIEKNKIRGLGYYQLDSCIRNYLQEHNCDINRNEPLKKIVDLLSERLQEENLKRKRHIF